MANMVPTDPAFLPSFSLANHWFSYLATSSFLKLVIRGLPCIWPLSYFCLIPKADHQGPNIWIYYLATMTNCSVKIYQLIPADPNTDLPFVPFKSPSCKAICCCFCLIQIQPPCLLSCLIKDLHVLDIDFFSVFVCVLWLIIHGLEESAQLCVGPFTECLIKAQ